MEHFMDWFLGMYGFLAISHIFIQMLFAHGDHRKQKSRKFVDYYTGHNPKISVIIPVYNEDPDLLQKCLSSITNQKYDDIEVIVVDDGSKNFEELSLVYNAYQDIPGFHMIFLKQNVGKRHAQKVAFDKSFGDILITIDSDTMIEAPDGIAHIVKQFKNRSIGAVTGDVRVINRKENFLTRLISYRYWTAFHQERAAQSLFNILMCCSGPFSAYRRTVVETTKERYISQTFLGTPCTYGDDRHLTNLVLEDGYQVCFDNRAIAYTNVPNTLRQYVRQQIRWNKSFYREMIWTWRHAHKHHWYMMYELLMQFFLPFFLVIALFFMAYQAVTVNIAYVWQYIAVLVAIAIVRAGYGIYRTGDWGFLRFIAYGFMHVFVLIPVRFYALATLRDTRWGTR